MSDDVFRSEPHLLASLIGPQPVAGRWRPDELGDVLRHQLRAPLVVDLGPPQWRPGEPPPAGSGAATGGGEAGFPPLTNFGELLLHPSPPLPLLILTKEFAKAADKREEGPLPPEVAAALYYAAIAAAFVRHGEWVTELSRQDFASGLAWLLGQTWFADPLRPLFHDAVRRLGEAEASGPPPAPGAPAAVSPPLSPPAPTPDDGGV